MADNDKTKDVNSFFAADPEKADREFFSRVPNPDRRGFLKRTGLATMAAMVGTSIPFHRNMPIGFVPAAMASEDVLVGKDGLTLLNDRSVNAETPPDRLCCTNGVRDSLFESSWVATVHEQLVPYEVQDQELAFVQHGAEAARLAISLV